MSRYFDLILTYWRQFQLRHVLLATVLLMLVGEQYPFSNFPMYSKLDAESDVLFITDQHDNPLPMHTLFGTSTSTQKKVYMSELRKICNAQDRDSSEATLEEKRQAGEKLMKRLMPRLKRHRLPNIAAGVTALRTYHKVFTLEEGDIATSKPVLIAETPL